MSIVLDGDKGVTQNTTEAARLPSGTTAERPANPVAGMIRFNTDEGYFEGYDPIFDDWFKTSGLPAQFQATGGTETTITDNGVDYKVHTLTSSGTFEVTQGEGEVEYLVVAGGGGGGGVRGGGGGAGGLIQDISALTTGSYPVIVGIGGNGGTPSQLADPVDAENGGNSSVFGDVALGGGGGGRPAEAQSGGSGGGGGGANLKTKGLGTAGQGNDGGDGADNGAGGGGGAGQAGESATGDPGANGGNGLEISINGNSVYYAGGGGGQGTTGGTGGLGGGGNGSTDLGGAPTNGGANLGGGGGGSGTDFVGGAGGSGIVIVRYPI